MIWIISIFTLFIVGCQQVPEEARYTEIVTEEAKPLPEAARMGMEDPHAGFDMSMSQMEMPTVMNLTYSWQAPEGWSQSKGSGMRLASFFLTADPEAIDCSVISLAGPAGGLEANLSRWMGQIGLKADAADVSALIVNASSIKVKGGEEGRIFDFTHLKSLKSSDKSMIVVMLPIGGETLFIKMTGAVEILKQQLPNFLKLTSSIEHADVQAVSDPHAGLDFVKDPHAGLDMASLGSLVEGGAVSNNLLSWTLPEGWKDEGASSMRLATFRSLSNPEIFDCSVISLGGPAGGIEANLLRWAAQLGLDRGIADITSKLEIIKTKDGMEAQVIDFSLLQTAAASEAKSMLAAIIIMDGSTIFIKMNASLDTIKSQKASFKSLITSISRQ